MDFVQPFAAVLLVLGLLGGALFVLRKRGAAAFQFPGAARLGQASGPKSLEVLERVALGPQHSLHLVRMGDRCVLIATAPSSCHLLHADAPEATEQ